MRPETEWLIHIMKAVGVPYIWGGKDPSKGLDCSGFTQYALKFLGLNPPGECNAQSLYSIFSKTGDSVLTPSFGDLLFFGKDQRIHHVAIALNEDEMVEAAHGNETITDRLKAYEKGAKVMVTNIGRMRDLYAIIRPRGYPWSGYDATNLSSRDPASQGRGQMSSPSSNKEAALDRSPSTTPYSPLQECAVPKHKGLFLQLGQDGVELASREKRSYPSSSAAFLRSKNSESESLDS